MTTTHKKPAEKPSKTVKKGSPEKKGKATSPRKVKSMKSTKPKRPQAHRGIVCSTKANVLIIYFMHATKPDGAYLGDIYQKVEDIHSDEFDGIITNTSPCIGPDGNIIKQSPTQGYC